MAHSSWKMAGCLWDGVNGGFQPVGSPRGALVACNNPPVSMCEVERLLGKVHVSPP